MPCHNLAKEGTQLEKIKWPIWALFFYLITVFGIYRFITTWILGFSLLRGALNPFILYTGIALNGLVATLSISVIIFSYWLQKKSSILIIYSQLLMSLVQTLAISALLASEGLPWSLGELARSVVFFAVWFVYFYRSEQIRLVLVK